MAMIFLGFRVCRLFCCLNHKWIVDDFSVSMLLTILTFTLFEVEQRFF